MWAEWLLILGKATLWWALPLAFAIRELWLLRRLSADRRSTRQPVSYPDALQSASAKPHTDPGAGSARSSSHS